MIGLKTVFNIFIKDDFHNIKLFAGIRHLRQVLQEDKDLTNA